MNYILKGHNFLNEIQTITQVFYPNEKFVESDGVSETSLTVISNLCDGFVTSSIYEDGIKISENEAPIDEIGDKKHISAAIKRSMFLILCEKNGYIPPWGLLTGIRPSKIVHELLAKGYDHSKIKEQMASEYFVHEDKIELCLKVALAENDILKKNTGRDYSLYIGIPFCPSKCLYCSFTSYSLDKYKNKTELYIDTLIREMQELKFFDTKRSLETVYFGGGTPTSLTENQLRRLLEAVNQNFDLSNVTEYTVEAGRPDTITEGKLSLLKQFGVNRISLNPQTMHDRTLNLIGRAHTVSDFLNAFKLARETGHDNINVDIILGLPEETVDDVKKTLDAILQLEPENLTVHTLAIKRASKLKESLDSYELAEVRTIEKMLALVQEETSKAKLYPYYMYRQKNMLGNFENVGYAKVGRECIYNIQIMEERQSILALGAGGITKIVDLGSGKIERVFNVKSVDDYISRLDEMLVRKQVLKEN